MSEIHPTKPIKIQFEHGLYSTSKIGAISPKNTKKNNKIDINEN